MSRISIKNRLLILSVVLLAGIVGSTVYLSKQLRDSSRTIAEENRRLEEIGDANAAHRAFTDLKYWLTELAVSLLTQSEQEVGRAERDLVTRLRIVAKSEPRTVDDIRARVAEMSSVGMMAVEAYTENRRVVRTRDRDAHHLRGTVCTDGREAVS